MKTKVGDRARWIQRINQHASIAGRLNREQLTDLIADVNDAAGLLERTGEALEYGGACTCIEADIDEPIPPCPRCELQPLVADFLKEPK